MGIDVVSLIIFTFCVVLFIWDKLPMATTAVLGCVLMVVFGVCDYKTAFGQFSSATVVLTIGVMVIGASISESGLAAAIGDWIVSISKGSETKLLIGTYLVSAAMSAFLTNSAVLAIFIPIIMGLSLSGGQIKGKNLIMPIANACVLGGASTLVGSTQQLTAQGLLEDAGLQMFKTFDFTPIGGVVVLFGLIYCLTVGRKLGQRIWGSREEVSDYVLPETRTDYQKSKIVIMACIFAGTVILYITEWVPLAITSSGAAVLCIITGCITQKKAILSVNWNIVGRLAGCLGIAKAIEAAKGTVLIANAFRSVIGTSISPFMLLCILVLMVQVMSELTVNSTALLVVLPILISVAPEMNLNPFPYALAITLASGCTLATPLASSTLGMSMVVGYRFNDYFKHNMLLDVCSYLIIIVMTPLLFRLTLG